MEAAPVGGLVIFFSKRLKAQGISATSQKSVRRSASRATPLLAAVFEVFRQRGGKAQPNEG